MSICYWGDKFYGINRITNGHLFDEEKEKAMILTAMEHLHFTQEQKDDYADNYEFTFADIMNSDYEDLIISSMFFLKDKVEFYNAYSSGDAIAFFGIDFALPWQIDKIESQKEVNLKIYNALKPILKTEVTFEQVEPLIQLVILNGQDDYVTYHERTI